MPIIFNDLDQAAEKLLHGELVAFPTETVYGLGALGTKAEALEKMYSLKGRPRNHPVIIHLHNIAQCEEWGVMNATAKKLAKAFWPGPLTLVIKAKEKAKYVLNQDTVAIRIPSHPMALRLLERVNEGVAAPSANKFGRVSPTTVMHVYDDFKELADLHILNGGRCSGGIESTIISCANDYASMLRVGGINKNKIKEIIGDIECAATLPAPGKLKAHYCPSKPLFLANSEYISKISGNIAVLSRSRPNSLKYYLWKRAEKKPKYYAKRLYASLRELDLTAADYIVIEQLPNTVEWEAIRDRLIKASAEKTLG